ncbi:hypothetical protein [Enterobacter cloacae]|uniref:hypothetical protein n=1 Tax=Enterobacter cloacae TaxID=550 RepID=UPI000BD64427|nr:hypothetical protein [Enterobacter cloacae]PCM83491.1 hypothetical protein CP903_00110 [Enterobacter cloacae]
MMNADYIQYESLIAARDAAYWAYLSMIGTWVSAIATLIAAAVAFWAIRGWRVQEEAHELKEFRICAYNFHNAMVCVPEYNSDGLNELQSLAVQNTFNALNEIYMSTLKMHSKKTRGMASDVFGQFHSVYSKYRSGEISNFEAQEEILKIRTHEPLLGIGLKE